LMTPAIEVKFEQFVRLPPLAVSEMVTFDACVQLPPESSVTRDGWVAKGLPDAPPTGDVTNANWDANPGPLGLKGLLLAVIVPPLVTREAVIV